MSLNMPGTMGGLGGWVRGGGAWGWRGGEGRGCLGGMECLTKGSYPPYREVRGAERGGVAL